jgi:cyclophilin family peptidyl-prolyl cis-trans isomerase
VPTNKQRREAAQRHLQRQLERRAEQAKQRKRNMGIVAALVAVLVVAAIVLLGTGVLGGNGDSDNAAASSAPASDTAASGGPAAPSTNADGTVTCDYAAADPAGGEIVDVGTPPDADAVKPEGKVAITMATNQGDLGLTLDRSIAPCAVESFAFLTGKKFFDDTPCHRLVTSESLGVLQCGDPTGTGSGGPGYRFAEEVTQDTAYPRGTIAMAKTSAPGTTGSQFFLVYSDSQLPPQYTVIGTVDDAGLKVLDKVAKAGVAGGGEVQDGAPAEKVTIESMRVAG